MAETGGRLLVVDDDPTARRAVRAALRGMAGVRIVAEGDSAAAAIALIREHALDAVLLDVQLPDQDGFAVVEAIGPARMPPVVFVTAFETHAVQAFDVFAVDYVVKPFTDDRLQVAVARALRRGAQAHTEAATRSLTSLLRALDDPLSHREPDERLRRFVIRDGSRVRFVSVDDVDWIEAEGNYVTLHTSGGAHLLRATLQGTLARLDPARFVRIHRSTAVNVDRVAEVRPWFGGDHAAILHDGTRLRVSRSYRDALLASG